MNRNLTSKQRRENEMSPKDVFNAAQSRMMELGESTTEQRIILTSEGWIGLPEMDEEHE